MDALEESAEFLGSLEKFFQRTDNARVKYAYMEAFNRLILPVAGVCRLSSTQLTDRLQPPKSTPLPGQIRYNLFIPLFIK
jgi:hypothetical protein